MLALAAATLVVCAPGSPGNTAEAQPTMDALARSLEGAAHLPDGEVSAAYEETEAGCSRRLANKNAVMTLATLPFYLAHEKELGLVPHLSAVPQGGEATERWTLVTGKDHPSSLEGYTVFSSAGFSKRFVRAAASKLPARVDVQPAPAILSALRRAASGEKVALLLDRAQFAAMGTLPFAGSLVVVETSQPMPVALVATVGKRIDERRWKELETAFLRLTEDRSDRNALDGVRMAGFVPLDEKALAAARTAWRRAR